MKNINDTILTDEELDNIAGGRDYEYELLEGPKGKYYKCTTINRTICIGIDKWDAWKKRLAERGDTIKKKEIINHE